MHASGTCRHATSLPARTAARATSSTVQFSGSAIRRSSLSASDSIPSTSTAIRRWMHHDTSNCAVRTISDSSLFQNIASTSTSTRTAATASSPSIQGRPISNPPSPLSQLRSSSLLPRPRAHTRTIASAAAKLRTISPHLPRHASTAPATERRTPEAMAREFSEMSVMIPALDEKTLESAFVKVIRADGLRFLDSGTIIRGANSLHGISHPEHVEWKTKSPALVATRNLLRPVMDELTGRSSKGLLSVDATFAFKLLGVHLMALDGNTDAARRTFRSIVESTIKTTSLPSQLGRHNLGSATVSPSMMQTLTQLIASHGRVHDPQGAFRCVAMPWQVFGVHVMGGVRRDRNPEVVAPAAAMRKVLFDVFVHEVGDPVQWYVALRHKYVESIYELLGHVLIECYCRRQLPRQAYAVYRAITEQRRLIDPHKATNQRPFSDFESITNVLRSLTDFVLWPEAALVYEEFRTLMKDRLHTDLFLSESMRYFSRRGDAASVEDVFAELKRLGIPLTRRHHAMRLHVHATLGDVGRVEQIWAATFSEPPNLNNPVTPSTSTSKKQALPTAEHFTLLITAHANVGDIDSMDRSLELMRQYGLEPGMFIFNEVIRAFAKRRDESAVLGTMQQMRRAGLEPNEATFLTLIRMYGGLKNIFAAEKLFRAAITAGLPISQRIVLELMKAHALSASWKGVIRVFDYVSQAAPGNSTWLDIHVYNILLRAYVLIGTPFETVQQIVDHLEELGITPNEETILYAIQSACDARKMQDALELFQRLEDLEDRAVKRRPAEAFALTMLIGSFLKDGLRDEARKTYAMMRGRDIVLDAVGFGTVVRAYGNEGTDEGVRLAEEFIASLADPNSKDTAWRKVSGRGEADAWQQVYTPILAMHATRRNASRVEDHFEALLKATDNNPSIIVLNSLMNTYRQSGDGDAMQLVWQRILDTALRQTDNDSLLETLGPASKATPSKAPAGASSDSTFGERASRSNILCVSLSTYILGLADVGRYDEVARVWQTVKSHGFGFDAHNWNHLALVLARAGEAARAFQVIERVILPSQKEVKASRAKRVESPKTPDSFFEPDEADLVAKPGEQLMEDIRLQRSTPISRRNEAMHGTRQRAPRTFGLYDNYDSPEDPEQGDARPPENPDMASSLFEYHQAAPMWNSWVPHNATLHTLSAVLQNLAAGRLIQPMRPGAPENQLVETSDDQSPEDTSRAFELYRQITEDSPLTMNALRNFQRRLKRDARRARRADRGTG